MLGGLSQRQSVVLSALAASPGGSFAPVQVQKLFFLIDENLAPFLGGRLFSFEPYDYGPFDKAVYQELDALAAKGLVEIYSVGPSAGGRRYRLSGSGEVIGRQALQSLHPVAVKYVQEVGEWVRKLSFAQLVGSIYKAFPQMREKSIFVE